eukprot:scaffold282089_cov16-Tisochrysis_lutea.AAC.1
MSAVVLATAGYDHTIKFWEATSGICYRTLQFPDSQVRVPCLAISTQQGFNMPDTCPAVAELDNALAIPSLNLTPGIPYHTIPYHATIKQVNKLEITADKTQIAAAGNSQIRIYDVNSNDPQPINSFEGHNGNVTALGFQKDTKWMYS